MKNIIIACAVLVGVLTFCSYDKEEGVEKVIADQNLKKEASQEYFQKWQLVKMTGQMANVPADTGDDMAWQAYYLLKEDSTFIKSRELEGVLTEASGTYAYVTYSNDDYLEFTYDSSNSIIGNCTSEPIELLRITSKNNIQGTWWACDGPGLFYELVE